MSWEAFTKSRFDEGGGVLHRNSIPCAALCKSDLGFHAHIVSYDF